MSVPLDQHQVEMERNRRAWEGKPLLREIYAAFYRRILGLVDRTVPGRTLEIGSGIGNLREHLPGALCTDLFPNPWLDLVCDGYELPFRDGSLSHLILFDVFHHLERPAAFLREARRVLHGAGRVILFEPYVSAASLPVYGWLHHEPVGLGRRIDLREEAPWPRGYYAAQGNATRLFFRPGGARCAPGWQVFHAEAMAGFSYLCSGGFSRPAAYPRAWLPAGLRLDAWLSRWPAIFGARCLVGLQPAAVGGGQGSLEGPLTSSDR